MQVLSDGLDVVLPLSLTTDPDSQSCLRLTEISSDIREPAKQLYLLTS